MTTIAVPDSFDLSEIQSFDTAEMVVLHPQTGKPTTWRWTIAGPGHPVTESIVKEIEREADAKRRRIEQARANGKKYKADDEDDARDVLHDRLARRVLGWTPVTIDGAPLAHSQAAVRDQLTNPRWSAVAAQYIEFLENEASFTRRSAKG